MSNITKVKINNDFVWDKISATASDAANKKYMAEESIIKSQWGTNNGEVELEKRDDGTYLIWDDGVAMGFTDAESANKIIKPKTEATPKPTQTQANPTENPKIILDETQRKSNPKPPTQFSTLGDTLSERLEKVSPLTGTEIGLESDLTSSLNEYDVNSEVEGIENVKQKLADDEAKRKQAEIAAAKKAREEELKKKYSNIVNDKFKIVEELKVGDLTIVGASKDGENSRIYLYNKDGSLKGSVKVPKLGNMTKISYNEETKEINITENGEIVSYKLDTIKTSVEKNREYILPNYKSEEYQQMLSNTVESYNQVDGVVSDYNVYGETLRQVGCGTASIMGAYAMLTGNFDFNPEEFVQDAIDQGYLTGLGSYSTMLPNEDEGNIMRYKWGLDAEEIDSSSESIIQSLQEGKKVMFNLRPNDGFYATGAGHYVLLDHYDEETNQIYVFDPAARGQGYRDPARMGYQDVGFLEDVMFNESNNAPVALDYME